MLARIASIILLFIGADVVRAQSYPFGSDFGLGLYAVYEDYEEVAELGWRTVHTYQESPVGDGFFNVAADAGLSVLARLPALDSLNERWMLPQSQVLMAISEQADRPNRDYWDLPEELRYWFSNEFEIVTQYTAWTRAYDPQQRPVYMYIPGHYDAAGITPYLPYLDIIPASCYPSYQGVPRTYVRWSIERTRKAINEGGYQEGAEYLDGEKTIYAILELFEDQQPVTATDLRHDFWLALACDVRGINVFSHFYRDASPELAAAWTTLNEELGLFLEAGLDHFWVEGTNEVANPSINSGPLLTTAFDFADETIQYSSLKTLRKRLGDTLVTLVVNSTDQAVNFTLMGTADPADVLSGELLDQTETGFTARVPAFGYYLQKSMVPAPADPMVRLDADGNIRIADTLFWPIGFYCEGIDLAEESDLAQTMHDAGFNILYTEGNMSSQAANVAFLDDCEALGIKNIYGNPVVLFDSLLLAEVIQRYLAYPSIIAYNTLDDANDFDAEDLARQNAVMDQFDTLRLRSASWYTSDPLTAMVPGVDIAGMQAYPWGNGTADLVASHFVLRAMADTARQLGKFPLATPQAFNWDDETYPPAAHLDCQSYLSLVTGNKGVMFYTFRDYDNDATIDETQPEIWAAASNFAREVRAAGLKEVILLGEFEHFNVDFYRYYGTWTYDGYLYLIAVNANDELTYDYDLPLPAELPAGVAEPLFPDRPDSLRRVGNRLQGQLTPYQVAGYRFALQPSSTSETVAPPPGVEIFPNPSDGRVELRLPDGRWMIELYDQNGRLVASSERTGPRASWNLSDLPAGSYQLQIRDEIGRRGPATTLLLR